jgi:hypothetical protein
MTAAAPVPPECREFQELVDRTYNFKPSKLSDAERSAKSAEMDKVWERSKSDPFGSLPCLKAALEKPNANSFFLFDGSTLLVTLDASAESKKLLIQSYAKSDLTDIVLSNWISPILKYGLEGMDTSAAGEAWLRASDPKYYLPQHGPLAVDKKIGALAIYGSMDERFATPSLVKMAASSDSMVREIAANLLLDQLTSESNKYAKTLDTTGLSPKTVERIKNIDEKPRKIVGRDGKPRVTREEYLQAFEKMAAGDARSFIDLTVRVPDGEKDAVVVLTREDVPLIRKARRFMASTGTPHTPEWYTSFTEILQAITWEAPRPAN